MQGPKGMAGDRQFCTFRLGDLFLGIDVLQVQEVLRTQAMTRVPLAPRAVRGLINLRGQIVTAIDLRERLGLPSLEDGRQAMNVVVRTEDGAVSLLVDDIGDVLEADCSSCEAPPETLRAEARELIPEVYKLPDRLLLILDTERALRLEAVAHHDKEN
ncbi:MAG TPA: chemotaxis protein CheW [Gemmatimonadales bacterium]|nr:chemotaxis protein CheW [Gemmatimonadales bacterium]